ncbi:hypothetical protein [Sphingomonas paucimobilis]|uniref:hypothetical protein n=1 Tax=Sphingomonas paucimobilis TaxID=13689 RepID=UPI0031CEB368
MKATIVCTPDCGGVDLRAAGAAIVIMTGDLPLKSERKIAPGASIQAIFCRDLIASRRTA